MTIDTKEFGHLMGKLIDAVQDMETSLPYDTARANLVAHLEAELSAARAAGLEEAAELLERQHTWITNVAAANLVRALATQPAPLDQQASTEMDKCLMCNGGGIVGFPPDQYEECPDCIKARASTHAAQGGLLQNSDVALLESSVEILQRKGYSLASKHLHELKERLQAAQGGGVQALAGLKRWTGETIAMAFPITRHDEFIFAGDVELVLAANPAPSAAPAQVAQTGVIGGQRWSKEGEMMESWVQHSAAQVAQGELLEAAQETLRMHDEVTGGVDYGYISPKLRQAVEAVRLAEAPIHAARDVLAEAPSVAVPVEAYLWLMGMGNDGFIEDRRGAFWWRSAFNERAGLDMMAIYEAQRAAHQASAQGDGGNNG